MDLILSLIENIIEPIFTAVSSINIFKKRK